MGKSEDGALKRPVIFSLIRPLQSITSTNMISVYPLGPPLYILPAEIPVEQHSHSTLQYFPISKLQTIAKKEKMSSTPTLPPLFYKELMNLHYSRKLFLQSSLTAGAPTPATSPVDPTEPYNGSKSFDSNVVMVLSVLLCALICSLGLNSIIKCALRCSSFRPTTDSSSTESSSHLANKGIKKKALKTFAVVNYSPDHKLPGLDTECVICLSEFALRDKVRLLPKCQHGFHVRCIDKWLNSHSSCPTCRHCLIETCQKIVGCDQASSSQSGPQSQGFIVNIAPLEREDLVRCFRGSN